MHTPLDSLSALGPELAVTTLDAVAGGHVIQDVVWPMINWLVDRANDVL